MIEKLDEMLREKSKAIQKWMKERRDGLILPIYASFDVRDNGIKASIVDSNLFPSGFHRLDRKAKETASKAFRNGVERTHKEVKRVMIFPLPYTRNEEYLKNILALKEIVQKAGYETTIAKPEEEFPDSIGKVTFESITKHDGWIQTKQDQPDFILLNTDLYKGIPKMLVDTKQPLMPTPLLGWHARTKYAHFVLYNEVAKEFCKEFKLDPWLLSAFVEEVSDVDFLKDRNRVAKVTERVIEEVQKKYDEYNVKEKPYAVIKDNSGTFGRGIFIAESGDDVRNMNSAQKRKMKVGQEGHAIKSVIVQEGITTKYYSNAHGTGEPVLYQVGRNVVGGFMRMSERGNRENLNAPGMNFQALAIDCLTHPLKDCLEDECETSLYCVLADLATIAIGREINELKKV